MLSTDLVVDKMVCCILFYSNATYNNNIYKLWLQLARQGFKVVLISRTKEKLESLAGELSKKNMVEIYYCALIITAALKQSDLF